MPEDVETLSAELHAIYQQEARRQAGTGDDTVRHPDEYAGLPEHTKEYDRVLARFMLDRERAAVEEAEKLRKLLREAWDVIWSGWGVDDPDFPEWLPDYEAFEHWKQRLRAAAASTEPRGY